MPATQRGQAYRLAPGKWGLRSYDASGKRRRESPFPTRSAALAHYREHVEPVLLGGTAPMPELTLTALVEIYLERHAASVRPGRSSRCASGSPTPPARSGRSRFATWSA